MRNPDCPRCGKIGDTFADVFWCSRCHIKFTRDGTDLSAPPIPPRERIMEQAKNFERAERYEDAARIYEKLEMWDKAGECRRTAKTNYDAKEIIKEKQVVVKIRCPYCKNLYEETYDKCPHCGGHS